MISETQLERFKHLPMERSLRDSLGPLIHRHPNCRLMVDTIPAIVAFTAMHCMGTRERAFMLLPNLAIAMQVYGGIQRAAQESNFLKAHKWHPTATLQFRNGSVITVHWADEHRGHGVCGVLPTIVVIADPISI